MKALVVADRVVEVADLPDPAPGPGEVVVAPHSAGICGSDVHGVEIGRAGPGQVLGHEMAGTVEAVGAGVEGWRPGDQVVVNPLGACGACDECRRGLSLRCQAVPKLGLTAPGGFAEYLLAPARQLLALPDGVGLEDAAHVEPLAVSLHAARLGQVAPGTRSLVYGVGPIGLSVVMVLRALGGGEVVAIGRSPGRRRAAEVLGADVVLDAGNDDVEAYLARRTGEFDAVFECSGADQALELSLPALRSDGKLVELALGGRAVPIDVFELVSRNVHLIGSCAFGPEEFADALAMMGPGRVDPSPLVSRRVGLAEAPQSFLDLRRPGELVGILVQPWR